jgi:hypothetical protein
MNPGAMKTDKMKNPWTDGPFIQPAADAVAPVELEDLSRFEGEGGPEAPVPAAESFDVPFENAVWRTPRWLAQPTTKAKGNYESTS